MRTRFRESEPLERSYTARYRLSSTSAWIYESRYYTSDVKREFMVDDPRWLRIGGVGRLAFKPTHHVRIDVIPRTELVPSTWGGTTLQYYEACDYYYMKKGNVGQRIIEAVLNTAEAPEIGHGDRWLKAKPSMSTRAGLSVFLYELREIKRMFDVIPRRHFRTSWAEISRDFARYGNNLHLNYNFGWKPFVRDLQNTYKALKTFQERLNRFLLEAGKDLKRVIRDPLLEISSESSETGWPLGWYCKWKWNYTKVHASTFQFQYEVPPYSRYELELRAVLDTLGLRFDPVTIWAVLSRSFVIDWFLDLGGYLDQFSSGWLEPWVVLLQSCSSFHLTGDVEVWCRRDPEAANSWFPVALSKFDIYHRTTGTKLTYGFNPGDLDADKIRLLASLVAGQIL